MHAILDKRFSISVCYCWLYRFCTILWITTLHVSFTSCHIQQTQGAYIHQEWVQSDTESMSHVELAGDPISNIPPGAIRCHQVPLVVAGESWNHFHNISKGPNIIKILRPVANDDHVQLLLACGSWLRPTTATERQKHQEGPWPVGESQPTSIFRGWYLILSGLIFTPSLLGWSVYSNSKRCASFIEGWPVPLYNN